MILRNRARGFTLVELLLVVGIIAILAAIAIPIYQNYVVRTRMAEVVLTISGCRTTVSEVYQAGGSPPGAGNWGCEGSGGVNRQVQSLTTDANGKIIATATGFSNSDIDGLDLTLMPMINGAAANVATDMGKAITGWRCGHVADGTTIAVEYLPASCIGS